MKNIMFFTHHLWGGGAEKTVCNISNYINRNYVDIKSYVCVVYDEPKIRPDVDNVIVLNNKTTSKTLIVLKPLVILKQINELRNIKRKNNIDVCISFLPGADLINVSSKVGEKTIVSVRNVESFFLTNPLKKAYDQYSYKRCDKIVAVSNNVKRDLVDNFGVSEDKITTIYNAIDPVPEEKTCIKEYIDFIQDKYIFINVARLAREKNQDVLIKAFYNVAKDKHNVGLVIVGAGAEEKALKELVKKLELEDKVLFTGKQPNPYDYLKKANAFVLSSQIEGMPNTLLEAMQCGLPCIATANAGAEVLAPSDYNDKVYDKMTIEKYGIVVPNENVDELAKAMILRYEKNIQRSDYARELLDELSVEKIVRQWLDVIM
jgi:glycosyltransferase involved in cell wall biosynthesis